jgi:hypothetical protein
MAGFITDYRIYVKVKKIINPLTTENPNEKHKGHREIIAGADL